MSRRVNIKELLADPIQRREIVVSAIMLGQVETGRPPDREKAEQAYNTLQKEINDNKKELLLY